MLLLLATMTALYHKHKYPSNITSVQALCLCFTAIGIESWMQNLSVHPPDLIQSEWGC